MLMDNYNFSGYATKNNLRCADGRVILQDAFKHNDGQTVPLVWQHTHNEPSNVLGHAKLENRSDGVYAYCKFNNTPAGDNAKQLVEHGDIKALSIYANRLKQQGPNVTHGAIREVSLVLTGANPGAFIDNINFAHSEGSTVYDDEAIIYTGEPIIKGGDSVILEHKEEDKPAGDDKTVQDVIDSMTKEQKDVMYYMIGQAIDGDSAEHSALGEDYVEGDYYYYDEEGEIMKHNVFEQDEDGLQGDVLSHDDMQVIFEEAKKCGSLKDAVLQHAGDYGIDNIDVLFPDAKTVTPTPEMITRNMEWVKGVISGTHHTPFSRIKSTSADITADEARARGYVTGNLKKEEVFGLLKRITTPTTIYKKQKLDRDDIIDITDFNVVAWLKVEMRMMLDEEIARAVLIGDGRPVDSDDKISETNIRPIYKDADMYAHRVELKKDINMEAVIEDIIRARKFYKGTGRPTFYTTTDTLTDMLLAKDSEGRRLYRSEAELVSDLRVAGIVEVEPMEGLTRTDDVAGELDLIGLMVNLKDYNLGADKGGQVNMFDDFDIDYNQHKYLIETRLSGALTKPKSALVFERPTAVIGG